MAEFEQIIQIAPAFSKRDPNPAKDYGIGAMKFYFILKGPKGAVQFVIGTDWYLPADQRAQRKWQYDFNTRFDEIQPKGWDVGYHSPVPLYEGQDGRSDCDLLPGGKCFYDGSGLRADEWVPDFLAGGTKWLWPRVEQEYRERFEPEQAA